MQVRLGWINRIISTKGDFYSSDHMDCEDELHSNRHAHTHTYSFMH